MNSYDRTDVGRSVEEIIDSIRPEIFYKSDELEVMPETFADLHRNVEYDGNKWHVKLFVNDDGDASVQVLSANWEGCPH